MATVGVLNEGRAREIASSPWVRVRHFATLHLHGKTVASGRMEKPGIPSIPQVARPPVRAYCRPVIWIVAFVCSTFLMSVEAAYTAKKKASKAPAPATEAPKNLNFPPATGTLNLGDVRPDE